MKRKIIVRRHPEARAEGSCLEGYPTTDSRFQNKFGMTGCAESWRSMLEMLGVLAIIGVLSVGGIAGYRSAMDKHRANTLLNEASKRAVIVAGQIGLMGQTPSLSDFNNNATGYGTFATTVYGAGGSTPWASTDDKFTLSIMGVSEAVCNQMKASKGDTVKGFSPEPCTDNTTVQLTYNNDLSTGDADTEASVNVVSCDNGNVYLSYNVGTEYDTTTPQNMECTKNSDCDSGEYCRLIGTWQDSCALITGGTCETLDTGRETTYTNGGDTKTFLVSLSTMTWWAAENWCKAHHKSLVSYNTVNSLFDCDKAERSCTWCKFTTSSYWSNGTLPADYWIGESYTHCDAWNVGVGVEGFILSYRRGPGLFALCE